MRDANLFKTVKKLDNLFARFSLQASPRRNEANRKHGVGYRR
jgi:hypothetical protein